MSPKRTHEAVSVVRTMRRNGASWKAIGEAVGVTPTMARCWIDPNYATRRRAQVNASRAPHRYGEAVKPKPQPQENVVVRRMPVWGDCSSTGLGYLEVSLPRVSCIDGASA